MKPDFKLDLEDWKDYDLEEWDLDEIIADSGRFWKGEYASKEQALSVQIRSRLN